MKEINIAKKLVTKRRERGVTQEELATYIGVSKASVSKWETGQSYPDITFLPQLATYFDISIDELMGYSPQMTKDDIKKLYHQISLLFANEKFEDALLECRRVIKKYYSCFPLLLQIALLLANHHMLAGEKKEQEAILSEAIELCVRIKGLSDDVWLSKEANSIESVCYLMLEKPQDALDLLGEKIRPLSTDYEVRSQAYQMMGSISKAKEVTQVSMYQHLIYTVGSTPSYLMLYADDKDRTEEILKRTLAIADIYNLEQLHPNTMLQIYFAAAQMYSLQENAEKALNMLKRYTDICTTKKLSFSLHGDSFFDEIDNWLADLDLGTKAPRDEKLIKEDMLKSLVSNPTFAFLLDKPQYKDIIRRLEVNIGCR